MANFRFIHLTHFGFINRSLINLYKKEKGETAGQLFLLFLTSFAIQQSYLLNVLFEKLTPL